ncbi:MAG: group II truncated hemoglobin [Solirubrobacteraceae bacterium]
MTDEPTIYEFAGGRGAWLRLADEQYHRCLKDPLLGEQFVEEHAAHVEHLAAWLAQVFGGPGEYTERFGGFTAMLDHHVGLAITDEQRVRFVEVTMEAAEAAGLPEDPRFRERLHGYIEWGAGVAQRNSHLGYEADRTATVPTWGWGPSGPPPGARER